MCPLPFKLVLKLFLLLTILSLLGLPADGQTSATGADAPICEALPDGQDAQEIVGRATYQFLGDMVKHNGSDYWQPIDGRGRALCLVETFLVDGQEVEIFHAGFLKGIQTVLYKVEVAGGARRVLHVFYSPALDFMSGTHLAFTVVEMDVEAGEAGLKFYAMYHSQPPYAQVRALIEAIVSRATEPTLTAHWQDNADEPLMMITGFK